MCSDIQKIIEPAYLIDRYLLTGFFLALLRIRIFDQRLWLQKSKIRVIALIEPIAGQAPVTGQSAVLRLFAQ